MLLNTLYIRRINDKKILLNFKIYSNSSKFSSAAVAAKNHAPQSHHRFAQNRICKKVLSLTLTIDYDLATLVSSSAPLLSVLEILNPQDPLNPQDLRLVIQKWQLWIQKR